MKYSNRDLRERRNRSEAKIVSDVYRRFCAMGVRAIREVPLLGRSIDLVYLTGRELISIEFKVRDWRRAIEQAKDHRLGIDFTYICLPQRKVSPRLDIMLKDAGVGLYFYSVKSAWPIEKVVDAPRSTDVWSVARAGVLDLFHAASRDE